MNVDQSNPKKCGIHNDEQRRNDNVRLSTLEENIEITVIEEDTDNIPGSSNFQVLETCDASNPVQCQLHPYGQRHVQTQVSWPSAVRQNPHAITAAITAQEEIRKSLGSKSVRLNCPNCLNFVTSITQPRPNALWLYIFGICSLFFDGCKDVEHRCSKCNAFLGIYRPSLQ